MTLFFSTAKAKLAISGLCLTVALSACQTQTGAGFDNGSSAYTAASASGLNTSIEAEGEILSAINAERRRAGLSDLSYNGQLTRAARNHALQQVRSGTFSHTGSNGSSVKDRANAAGYKNCLIAENISRGLASAPAVTAAWMQSEGHRRNILTREFTDIGIGIGEGAFYVTVFGQPC